MVKLDNVLVRNTAGIINKEEDIKRKGLVKTKVEETKEEDKVEDKVETRSKSKK